MYRDSQHGLTIDVSGPDGNVFVLMGTAKNWCQQLGWNWPKLKKEMTSGGDYDHVLAVFKERFKHVVTVIGEQDDRE